MMNSGYLAHLAETGAANIHPGGIQTTRRLIASSYLETGQRILEIGCGTGETLIRIAAAKDVFVEGVDVMPEMLRVAKFRMKLTGLSKRGRLHLIYPNKPLPFEDARFDRVYAESVFGFQEAKSAGFLLSEAYRVLAPGGLFLLNEAIWKDSAPAATIRAINRSCKIDFGISQASPCGWRLKDWLREMGRNGFDVLSAERFADLSADSEKRFYRGAWRILLSKCLTWGHRAKAVIHPIRLRNIFHYRQLMNHHREDGQYIEGRLFVLQKKRETDRR